MILYDFSVDYNTIGKSDILNIDKCLITKNNLIKQVFVVLLSFSSSLARVLNVRTKCLSLNDEPCVVIPTLNYFNSVDLKYYAFMISLDK